MRAKVVKRPSTDCVVEVGSARTPVKLRANLPQGEVSVVGYRDTTHKVPLGTTVRTEEGSYWKAVGQMTEVDDRWKVVDGWQFLGQPTEVVDHVIETRWFLNAKVDEPEAPLTYVDDLGRRVSTAREELRWTDVDLGERSYANDTRAMTVDVAMACPLYSGAEISCNVEILRDPRLGITMPTQRSRTYAPKSDSSKAYAVMDGDRRGKVDTIRSLTDDGEECWSLKRSQWTRGKKVQWCDTWLREHGFHPDGNVEHKLKLIQDRIYSLEPIEASEFNDMPRAADPNSHLRRPLRSRRFWDAVTTVGDFVQIVDAQDIRDYAAPVVPVTV